MTAKTLTCDRVGGLMRVAIWSSKTLDDLYIDSLESPDSTGALVRAKAVRVAAGGKKTWFDAGLPARLYLEAKQPIKAGEVRVLRIKSTIGQNKAWPVELASDDESGAIGIIDAPPQPWLRALLDLKSGTKMVCHFEAREDEMACRAYLEAHALESDVTLAAHSREKVHPELDSIIDELMALRVALKGGGEIVIQQTEALVAIDVNEGEGGNPTNVNLEAVREAARQIRLRNLSGLIVIDALKMAARADASKVLNALKRVAEDDPADLRVFGMTKLGLIELTRTRRGPSLNYIGESS